MPKVNGAFRSKRGFTAVDNSIIRDKSISLKAKGLYLVIQSYITNPNFTCTKAFLLSTCMEGEKAFNASWDELKEHGYLRVHFHVEKGKKGFISEYELLDIPEEGPHTFYYDAEGNIAHTNLTKYKKDGKESPSRQEMSEKERNPHNGIYVNGSYVDSTYVERSYANGGDNINTLSYTQYSDYTGKQNKTEIKTLLNNYTDIDQSINLRRKDNKDRKIDTDSTPLLKQYESYFRDSLDYDILKIDYPNETELLEGILDLLTETCASQKKAIRVAGEERPSENVKGRLMKLNSEHIKYVLRCLRENSTEIKNIKQYLLTALFNAPITIDAYNRAKVNHDIYRDDDN